ncbi:unnamed protein product [Heterobilharzia americana]|nr:unnamed protein product [Heterobilharzia americana]
MVLWPSLWSVNLMQSNIEEPLNRQPEIPEQTTNQCTESMISNSEKCTPFLVSSPLSTSSSPTTSNFQKKFEIQEGPNQKSSCSEPDKFENGKCSSSNKPTELLQDIHESVPSCVFLLRSHPVLGLLPHEIASRVDSYKASKMCHICLKEFTDEMTVLHHQVEAHSLEDV